VPVCEFQRALQVFAQLLPNLCARAGDGVGAHLGLSSEPREDHAQYINSWLRVLKADKRAIFTAASKAQQACDWLIQRAGGSARAQGVAA